MSEGLSKQDRLTHIIDLASSIRDDLDVIPLGFEQRVAQLAKQAMWLHEIQEETLTAIEDNHQTVDVLTRMEAGRIANEGIA